MGLISFKARKDLKELILSNIKIAVKNPTNEFITTLFNEIIIDINKSKEDE